MLKEAEIITEVKKAEPEQKLKSSVKIFKDVEDSSIYR